MTNLPPILDFARLRAAYAAGLSLFDMVEAVSARLSKADPAVFISRASDAPLHAACHDLLARFPAPNSAPLWGIPFAVKDNINVAGLETTAGCPAFAYRPTADAAAVARLKEAGALVIGKTNLDQFATGLNGTRSPYGAPRCVFDAEFVSGGSSSGSAVAVAAGLAAFALGTDTAGSGRVPAAFNNIVGLKPSPGRVSILGVVPACRSIDVVTVFAPSVADAAAVRGVMEGFDGADPFSRRFGAAPLPARLRLGVPAKDELNFFGNTEYEAQLPALPRGGGLAYHPPAIVAAPARPGRLHIAVVGAHLSGMPLNHELTTLSGALVREAETAAGYRLYALAHTVPAKPGLVRAPGFDGGRIALEIWSLPAEGFARFVDRVPQPLCIGRIALADGTQVAGFLCEPAAVDEARDITAFGGWRRYISSSTGVL